MGFDRWGYHFEGCYVSPDELDRQAGVYVIWCKTGDSWTVLDVGESHDVQTRLNNHERADCWRKNCNGVIYYSACYFPSSTESARLRIEEDIRNRTKPPCGDR